MASNFLSGRDYLKKKKFKENKKLISVALGFPDLVFAVGAVPVFPIRMETFDFSSYLTPITSATSFTGTDDWVFIDSVTGEPCPGHADITGTKVGSGHGVAHHP